MNAYTVKVLLLGALWVKTFEWTCPEGSGLLRRMTVAASSVALVCGGLELIS